MDPYQKYIASNPQHCRVCQTPFSVEVPAITKEFTGELYSFCSTKCISEFEEDPEKFVKFADDNGDE